MLLEQPVRGAFSLPRTHRRGTTGRSAERTAAHPTGRAAMNRRLDDVLERWGRIEVSRGAKVKTRRYIAFLRAINVGGLVVKMAALKKIFEDLKLAEVETFIASGNVIFGSLMDAAKLETVIETGLEKALGYPVVTFLRTTEEVAAVAERDPFGTPVPP